MCCNQLRLFQYSIAFTCIDRNKCNHCSNYRLTVSEFKDKLEACNPNLIIEISDAGDLKFKFEKRYKDNSLQHSEITKAECGLILFSSGTTGKPKTMLLIYKMLKNF